MNVSKILELALPDGVKHRVSYHADIDVTRVVIEDPAQEEAHVVSILEALNMVPVPYNNRETASFNAIEYTNDPDVIAAQYEGEADPEMASALDDEDAGEELFTNENMSITVASDGSVTIRSKGTLNVDGAETARSLDAVSDESKLKVLGNPDMMKFANKVFDMVSPGDDKSNYAAFLYNFDDFLLMHKPDSTYTAEDDDGEDAEEDELDTPAIESASLVKLFDGDVEVANAFIENFKTFALETARKSKKKNPRSALLSVLMKAMSGEHGIDAVSAWEQQDLENLKQSLSRVADTIVGTAATQFTKGGAE